MSPDYSLAAFDYVLPPERIALYPIEPRHNALLLVYDRGSIIHGHRVFHLPDLLPSFWQGQRPLLVFNDSRVFKARLLFTTDEGQRIEIFLLRPWNADFGEALSANPPVRWKALVGNARKWKKEKPLRWHNNLLQLNVSRQGDFVVLEWYPPTLTLAEVLEIAGEVPLPPYIKRKPEISDTERYQTSYAREAGSVAAPTAGLHFTPEVMEALRRQGIPQVFLTLHVGIGTFAPVRHMDDVRRHSMHPEIFNVTVSALETLASTTRPIVAVGTTSLRTLETLYWLGVQLLKSGRWVSQLPQNMPYEGPWNQSRVSFREAIEALKIKCLNERLAGLQGETSLYIYPGYQVRSADALLTNFHQPRSTLLMLVEAFVGTDWRRIYSEALQHSLGYRFLSYGDTMLLIRPGTAE
ncbi:MAG: S-adenosylmethionine:tRNA ribosyltransferase-isomerase [Flavobacteriales bacterium]|nr:S-adenosylmethionine:tRNA ribosyltransferase-isomerase [Flavobacteriales bacterium]MCX7767863.1 S-adenosylmethionine:tRNA ribosyltransferase-isomerase [Flavobacteriales bacterium]MDW8410478.1 S-adenosylmethionine:tRNA ribosyltransferase-isomerase [Flavobacteriales bacterium]